MKVGERASPDTIAQLRALVSIAADIVSHLDLEATLLSILTIVVDVLGAEIAGVLLADDDAQVLRTRACTGHRTVYAPRLEVRPGQGVAGKIYASGQPVMVNDYYHDVSISQDFFEFARAEGTRSALGAPLILRGEVIGTLMVWSRHVDAFSEADVEALVNLSNLATIAIENARLYETQRTAARTIGDAHRELEEQYDLLQRAFGVHEELTALVLRGKGLADLVQTVARLTGGVTVVLGSELAVLAASLAAEEVVLRARAQLVENDAQGTRSIAPRDGTDRWLLMREVAAGGERLGHVCVGLPHAPSRLDAVVVEQAAVVCALQLTKERAVIEAHNRVRGDFLWDLLDGNLSDDTEAVLRARHLGYSVPTRVRVMLISVGGLVEWAQRSGANSDAVDRRQRSLVRTAEQIATRAGGAEAFAARRGAMIALLVPSPDDAAHARRLAESVLRALRDQHPDLAVSAGMSTCVPMAGDLSPAFTQAQHALSALPLIAQDGPVALFDELGILRFVLAPGDRDELSAFARKVLGPVISYDRRHDADLVRTIEAYLANDCSLLQTAESLFVHPKTVRYRLDRVEKLAGLRLSRQRDRFDAHLAITIVQGLSLCAGGPITHDHP